MSLIDEEPKQAGDCFQLLKQHCGMQLLYSEPLCFPLDLSFLLQTPAFFTGGGLLASAGVQANQRGSPPALTSERLRQPRAPGLDGSTISPPGRQISRYPAFQQVTETTPIPKKGPWDNLA